MSTAKVCRPCSSIFLLHNRDLVVAASSVARRTLPVEEVINTTTQLHHGVKISCSPSRPHHRNTFQLTEISTSSLSMQSHRRKVAVRPTREQNTRAVLQSINGSDKRKLHLFPMTLRNSQAATKSIAFFQSLRIPFRCNVQLDTRWPVRICLH